MKVAEPRPIREFALGIYDGPHATPKESPEGAVFLGIKNITEDGHLDLSEIRYVSEEEFPRWTRRVTPQAGDVVLTYEATLHRYAIIPEGFRGCLGRRVALIRPNPKKADSRYLLYYFQSHSWRTIVESYVITGATVDRIPLESLPEFPVRLPKVETQKEVADLLSAYDELIENNQRRMALLGDAARLLYQEWFVYLRFPGHEHPSTDNGVPIGWKRLELRNIIDVTHGYAFKGEYFAEEPTSRVLTTPGNFKVGGGIKLNKLKFYSEEGPLDSSYALAPMDLILTMTDLSQEGDTLGFPAFVPRLNGLTFLHNQRLGKVIPRGQSFPKYFLYCLFCDERYRHHVVGAATGTSVKHTSPKRILSHTATLPPIDGLIDAFDNAVKPLVQQVNCLIEMNQKLRAARDMLLPRLMSGEIEV